MRCIASGLLGIAAVASLWALPEGTSQTSESSKGRDPAATGQDDGVAEAEALIAELEGEAAAAGDLAQRAFDAFEGRMAVLDGGRATRLARGMHRRWPAIWSAFCLEGALRRSATVATGNAALAEAEQALVPLLAAPIQDQVALYQRLAILYAGFGRRSKERAALGAALVRRGVDASQISGLNALRAGRPETSVTLFASLLDRQREGHLSPVDGAADPGFQAPWALRGFGLATLELVTNDH